MDFSADQGNSLGASAGNGLSSEKVRPDSAWLFYIWPVRQRLSDA